MLIEKSTFGLKDPNFDCHFYLNGAARLTSVHPVVELPEVARLTTTAAPLLKSGIYLRNHIYYFASGFIYTGERISPKDGLKRLIDAGIAASKATENVKLNTIGDRLVKNVGYDHLKEACLLLIQGLQRSTTARSEQIQSAYTITESVITIYYSILLNGTSSSESATLTQLPELYKLLEQIDGKDIPLGLRELSHPGRIASFVKSIHHHQLTEYDLVVGLANGGSELPFAYNAIGKLEHQKTPVPTFIIKISNYSNEQHTAVPTHRQAQNILILDNNARTFRSMEKAKSIFKSAFPSAVIHCAVSELHTPHLDAIAKGKKEDDLAQDTTTLLDYPAQGRYVTSYDYRGIQNRATLRLLQANHLKTPDIKEPSVSCILIGGDFQPPVKPRKIITQTRRLVHLLNNNKRIASFHSSETPIKGSIKDIIQHTLRQHYSEVQQNIRLAPHRLVFILPSDTQTLAQMIEEAQQYVTEPSQIILYNFIRRYWKTNEHPEVTIAEDANDVLVNVWKE